jgi:glycerol-3-phosphate dehydrogenase
MWLYDALSMFEAPELHERLTPEESLERLPLLQSKNLLGSYVYSDAYMDDDRLVMETLRSAVKLGAAATSYVSADGAELVDGKIKSVYCTDKLNGRRLQIRAQHVISTVGPWTDMLAPKLIGEWRKTLRPSKGVHLTFDRKRLQLNQAVVMAADNEKRIVFGIPRQEMTIIGTTDTDYSGDPADVSATPEDVEYLLRVAGEYFPGAKLTASDIISSYAGVRPLVDDGAETESKTSREHVIIRDPHNVTFVAGGKYTTYRRMAEQTVSAALESFSVEDQVRFGRNDTKRPLNEEATVTTMDESLRFVRHWAREFDIDESVVEVLVGRHAREALSILEDGRNVPKNSGETADERLWNLEARHAIRNTMCMSLIDFYMRRTPLFLSRADHGLVHIEHIAKIFAHELNWSDSRRQEQTAALKAHINHELQWKLKFGLSASSL